LTQTLKLLFIHEAQVSNLIQDTALTKGFLGCPQPLQTNTGLVPYKKKRPLPTHCPFNYSLTSK